MLKNHVQHIFELNCHVHFKTGPLKFLSLHLCNEPANPMGKSIEVVQSLKVL